MSFAYNPSSKKSTHFMKFLDWLFHMVAYALILVTVSLIFKKTFYIDNSHFGLWCLLAAIIIYVFNKTIKPMLVWLTLPITGLTLGFFYPFINVIILYLVDWLLGSHLHIRGVFMCFIVAVFISFMNILVDTIIIEPIMKRGK